MPEPALAPAQAPGPPSPPPLRIVGAPAPGRPEPRLLIPAYDLNAALALERKLGISHVLAQTLVRRGLGEADAARAFLEAREEHPASAFAGIERALALIARHVQAGSRITVHGDYDVDGVCATAILVRALRSLGAEVDWFIPSRTDDGYGLSLASVERLAARGTRLLITADCAITAVEEVAAARARGLDVIVTDHHHPRPDGVLPDCPVVHPAVCGYPCTELCGSAVAFKLAEALEAPSAADDLELVALATVADLMALRGENRRLVRAGLADLAGTAKPGLRALMAVSGVDPSALDARALGFRLGPRINAAGRLRRADAGVELLLTHDQHRAEQIAAELDEANAERRAIERQIAWDAEAQAASLGDRSAFVLVGEEWHPGVIGIVASRIVERFHRPAVLVALDSDGTGSGSARSVAGFDLLGALHACAEHLERYGGHRAAAGLTIRRERLEQFRAALESHADGILSEDLRHPVESVDAIVSGSELGLALAEELELLEPCGIGNPRPRLLVPGARLHDLRPMGEAGRHARFMVAAGGARTPAVAFGCEGRLVADPAEPVDATFRLERNCWRGTVEPRLSLGHAWSCTPAAIGVLGEPKPDQYVQAAIDELDRRLELPFCAPPAERVTIDRRAQSPLAVLADALAAGERVLAVCADVSRRLPGLQSRIGGFDLISYHALEDAATQGDPEPPTAPYDHVVALDPPAGAAQAELLTGGRGFAHLAWGPTELRFAQQMHELEYGLRASLVALYRSLRLRRRVAGEELERLLRGEGPHDRPARLAGRLIRVLAELELVSLDRDLPALAIAGLARTALDRSPSYRVYAKRHEDGQRFLSSNPNLAASQRP